MFIHTFFAFFHVDYYGLSKLSWIIIMDYYGLSSNFLSKKKNIQVESKVPKVQVRATQLPWFVVDITIGLDGFMSCLYSNNS